MTKTLIAVGSHRKLALPVILLLDTTVDKLFVWNFEFRSLVFV